MHEAGKGKFFVGWSGLIGPTDILMVQRGHENLVLEIFRHPGRVKDLTSRILELWHRYYDELQNIVEKRISGSSNWMGVWSPKRFYPPQCDFSVMISPKMFEEFVLPFLQEQYMRLDHTIYHMDGPDQIPHLDLLLNISELNGIQWVPGAGNPSTGSPKMASYV